MLYLTNVTVSLEIGKYSASRCEFATVPSAAWHAFWEYTLKVLGHLANNLIPVHTWFPYEKNN